MKRIGLVVKSSLATQKVVRALMNWLTERGLEVFLDEAYSTDCRSGDDEGASGLVSRNIDLAVVLGGDGTMLYAARTLGWKGIPILGVNMGGLGFLTEINLENMNTILEKVLAGDYTLEARMLLSVTVEREGEVFTRQTVLNDAVINKGALARILNLKVRVDGIPLTTYRADGLIISTPTGSTAYNLSAGGPIIHPVQELVVLTPICSFTLSTRPLILARSATIEVEVDLEASDVILTSDGQVSCPLEPGDKVIVKRSENSIFIIKNPYKDYFEILRTKLGWG